MLRLKHERFALPGWLALTLLLAANSLAAQTTPTAPPQPAPALSQPTSNDATASADVSGKPSATTAENPPLPTIRKFGEGAEVSAVDPRIAPPVLPKAKLSLIGGIVRDVDPIRERMTVNIFGGKKMKLIFDQRSRLFVNGKETDRINIHKGDRVYLDTQAIKGKIFARTVQVQTRTEAADISGQLLGYNPRTNEVTLRDQLSARPVTLLFTPATTVSNQGRPATSADLLPGALVSIQFLPTSSGRRALKDVKIIAAPGSSFAFYGTVTFLDLRSGMLALESRTDGKLYDVKFPVNDETVTEDLRVGSEVMLNARFDGRNYVADSVNVMKSGAGAEKPANDNSKALDKANKKEAQEEKEDKVDSAPEQQQGEVHPRR